MSVAVVDAGPQQISRSVEVQAPAAELFAIVADPTRHHEVDGSGTVRGNIRAPAKFGVGARFSTRMRMYGMPYRITSTVTALVADKLIEWHHPVGHRWRWEFEALSPTCTRVTETFDYRDTGRVKDGLKYYERVGFAKRNAAGIEATLSKLRDRYASPSLCLTVGARSQDHPDRRGPGPESAATSQPLIVTEIHTESRAT